MPKSNFRRATRQILSALAFLTSLATEAQTLSTSLPAELYPKQAEQQAFVANFFDILQSHKVRDPLLEGKGPSIAEFSLDRIKFAFLTNVRPESVDLVFFNWDLPVFAGLKLNSKLSALYGSPVYDLKDVDRKSIASQGANRSQTTNFSYVLGANFFLRQVMIDAPPGAAVPPGLIDWKPHPDYMDRDHPLRKTLDIQSLVILSPDPGLYFQQSGITPETQKLMEESMELRGGFTRLILGMMVHEMFHVKEGLDQVQKLASRRKIYEDRQIIIDQLQKDATLRSLFATYVKIVFSIGDGIPEAATKSEAEKLADLASLIAAIKAHSPAAWKFIWNYEYTEGFAEYASSYSLVQVEVTPLTEQIQYLKSDAANNFAYRSGAIGGLYLALRLKQMPFANQEDHRESLWEIVLRLSGTKPSVDPIATIQAKYENVQGVNGEDEVRRVIDYLISTVMEVK